MMGRQRSEHDLFSYHINLHERVRADHPLRRVMEVVDFEAIRAEVAPFYGRNGNVSVDPAVLMKMFLLFFDDVPSERELLAVIPERLDYLFFLGYGLDDTIPNHSVLSKARARWGKEVFERIFVRTVSMCVEAGLVGGSKIHMDSTLVDADASTNSVLRGGPHLIAALKQAYREQERKLEGAAVEFPALELVSADEPAGAPAPDQTQAQEPAGEVISLPAAGDSLVKSTHMSTTDPDATPIRHTGQKSRPRYKHHRAVDDIHGVITAVETTSADVDDGTRLLSLAQQHGENTGAAADTIVGDSKYGTVANFIACQQDGIAAHMGNLAATMTGTGRMEGIYDESRFDYDAQSNTFTCPAGEKLSARRLHPTRLTYEYVTRAGVCAQCPLQKECTRSKSGRTLHRHRDQDLLDQGRAQSASEAARRDRKRRQHLMERSFADAANNHGIKRSRWRRLWRQEIQDHLIAACQNVRILISRGSRPAPAQAKAGVIVELKRSGAASKGRRGDSYALLRRRKADFDRTRN